MKTALAVFGAIHILLMTLGNLNFIDYHLCIADAGKCKMERQQ